MVKKLLVKVGEAHLIRFTSTTDLSALQTLPVATAGRKAY